MRDYLIFAVLQFVVSYIVTALAAVLMFSFIPGYGYEEAKAIGFILGNAGGIFNSVVFLLTQRPH